MHLVGAASGCIWLARDEGAASAAWSGECRTNNAEAPQGGQVATGRECRQRGRCTAHVLQGCTE